MLAEPESAAGAAGDGALTDELVDAAAAALAGGSGPPVNGAGSSPALAVLPVGDAGGAVRGVLLALGTRAGPWSEGEIGPLQDVADLAAALGARRAERRLRLLFDEAFQLMGLLRPDGTVVEVNRPVLFFSGKTREEIVGRPVWDIPTWRSDEERETFLRALDRAAAGEFVRYDVHVDGAVGSLVVDLSLKPIPGEDLIVAEARLVSDAVYALHMQEALHAGHVGTWTIDMRTDAVERSGRTDAIFGFPDDGASRTVADYLARVPKADALAAREEALAAIRAGAPFTARLRVLRPDGTVRQVLVRGEGFRGADGQIERLTGALTDVTDREAAEEALRHAEALRRVALDAVGMGTWAWDLAGGDIHADARLRVLLGFDPEEPIEIERFYERVHPDDLEDVRAAVDRSVEQGVGFELEFRVLRPEGGYRWLAGSGRRLSGPDGRPGWLVGVTFDVSERRAAQEVLRQSEARFRRIAEALPQVVFIAGPDGSVEYLNEQGFTYTGRDPAEGPGVLWEALHPEDAPLLQGVWEEFRGRGQALGVECRLRAADGSYRWFLLRCVPVPDAAERVTAWFGAATDIHLQKTVEATLERRVAERTAELHRSNQELDQFAYVASHDLKAPLRGIANLATWIEEDVGAALPPESRRHLALLRGRVQRMERLLDDLLAYSRIGRVEAAPERLDPAEVVHDVVELLAPPEGFTVRVRGPMPVLVTPRAPFEGVLRNLIHNAIKHHHRERGTVVVSARETGDGFVQFTVADDGPGIAPAYHERIFRLFQTLRPRDEVEGSGMGLAYVKKAVETMGGTVRVESEPGRGAAFRFTWPVAPPDPRTP